MALQTPRQRGMGSGIRGPSLGHTNTASSPSLRVSTAEASRKASLRALTGQPTTPSSATRIEAADLEIGDIVNVPGDMYGTVKFVGTVSGKSGKFVGVELGREFAARGKNDGDVDGTHYFHTSVPGSGIFLPVHRAEKRHSPSASSDSFPVTPKTPSFSAVDGQRAKSDEAAQRPASVPKFSQSAGPGARPSSPPFKPKRPSLPRPESPVRKQQTILAPTPGKALSASQRGGSRTATGPTASPSKNNLRSSTTTRPSTANSQGVPRPYSRTGSRVGNRQDALAEEGQAYAGASSTRNGSTSSVPSLSQPPRSTSRLGSAGGQDAELERLRHELAERDKRLSDQAVNLADMEASVRELSALLPGEGERVMAGESDETVAQLRQMLREKNEKMTMLTSEFDSHRADFRSTLDSLEMASTETERVYEEQKRDLIGQVEELSVRLQELEDLGQSKKEFDDVARQLKQLEDFVQELEEGLEDARRGEAEARGEVEFLRGEVERGRSELKREREKAAAATAATVATTHGSGSGSNGTGSGSSDSPRELEQKEDEIRGLKAIIHSFSATPDAASAHVQGGYVEVQRLQTALDVSHKEKERLEHELEQLRRASAVGSAHHARNESELTATGPVNGASARSRAGTLKATFAEHAARRLNGGGAAAESQSTSPSAAAANINGGISSGPDSMFCDMCSSRDHDTLDCAHFAHTGESSTDAASEDFRDPAEERDSRTVKPSALGHGKDSREAGATAGAGRAEDKWCALCEKDGHLAYECPDEQY